MAVTTFAAPILPGKTEAWKQAASEMSGARRAEFDDCRRRMGVTREVVSLQETPAGDFVCVMIEGDDPDSLIARYLASDHPSTGGSPTPFWWEFTEWTEPAKARHPNQLFFDWSA